MSADISILHFLYSISGVTITALYIPQLIKIIKAQSDLKDISITTWATWGICMIISGVYSLHVAQDWKLTVVALGGSLFCLMIASVTLHKRFKYRAIPVVGGPYPSLVYEKERPSKAQ